MSSLAERWGLDPAAPKSASEQFKVLQTRLSPPIASDDRYRQIRDVSWHDGTIHRQISGVELVIDSRQEPWSSLHNEALVDASRPHPVVSHLDIFCDTLRVTGKLTLPQAKIRIFARKLIFADSPDAVLSTSANPWLIPDAPSAKDGDSKGGDGLPGRSGGLFEIYVASVEVPANRSVLLAAGCAGQNAGAGRNGEAGRSVEGIRHIHDEFSQFTGTQGVDFNFDPPATFFTFRWDLNAPSNICGGVYSDMEYGKRDNWPTNGADATPPGKPGDASDGGALITNQRSLAAYFFAPKGEPGRKAQDARGGAHGSPKISTKHHVKGNVVATGFFSRGVKLSYQEQERKEVHNGKDAPAPEATRSKGVDGTAKVISNEFCWLSTEALQPVFQYVRDLMFAGYSERAHLLLGNYEEPLREVGAEAGDLDVLAWARAESETLRLRINSNLDYFGNPAGFTPGYSLGTTIGIHQAEIDLLMGQMLLAFRLEASQRNAKSLSGMMAELQAATQSQLESSVDAMINAEKKALAIRQRIENELQPEIAKIQVEMQALESRIREEIQGKLERDHAWRGALQIAGAVCQMIPVGQPVLGQIGNAGAFVSNKLIGREDSDVSSLIEPTIKLFDGATDVCSLYSDPNPKKANTAKPVSPSDDAKAKQQNSSLSKDVRKEPRGKSLFTIEEENSKAKPGWIKVDEMSDGEFKTIAARDFKKSGKTAAIDKGKDEGINWAQYLAVGKALAPAAKKFFEGVSEFKVSAEEVDAHLQKIKIDSKEWRELVKKIKVFNEKKSACLGEIEQLGLTISACIEEITTGAALYFRVKQEGVLNGREMSAAVQSLSRVMRVRAERSLLRSLYLMIKAHEALLLQTPKDIDWRLDQIAEKALGLAGSSDASGAGFKEQREQLGELFRSNITAFRDSLIRLHEPGRTLARKAKVVLTADSSRDAELFNALNSGQKVRIDPLEYGLIKADEHRARLAKISLVTFEFEGDTIDAESSRKALHGRSMDIYLEVAQEGAVRRGSDMFWFRSDRCANWSWSCWEKTERTVSGSPWEIKASVPSLIDADVLEFLVGKTSAAGPLDERRERARSALSMPPLWSAMNLWIAFNDDGGDSRAAPRLKRLEFVVDYESDNAPDTEATLVVRTHGEDPGALLSCTPDLAGRADGYANGMLRIFKKSVLDEKRVRLLAPDKIGDISFAGWIVHERGRDPYLVNNRKLWLSMNTHTQVLCQWQRFVTPALRSTGSKSRYVALRASADLDAGLIGIVESIDPGVVLQTVDNGWRLMQFGQKSGWVAPI